MLKVFPYKNFLKREFPIIQMNRIVSIITPSFNQGQFIEETIQSVLDQDYSNIEYVIVDGGSTDNTLDILRRFGDRIRWISEKDAGQADAISKGVGMTTGDVIHWLNSDDILLPGAVSKVMACFQNSPEVKLVYGRCYYCDRDGEIVGSYPTETFDLDRLAMFNFIAQPSAFIKRDAFLEVSGLDQRLNYLFDVDLWIKIGMQFKTLYLPEYLSEYRLHDTSKTVDKAQALSNSRESLEVVFKHFNWAPSNRVFGYYHQWVKSKLGSNIMNTKPVTIPIALFVSVIKYLQLNRSVRSGDLKALRWDYIKRMGVDWNDLYKG